MSARTIRKANTKRRVDYLDYIKGLGILLIMFAHCTQYFAPMAGINGYVCSFHVPIFFIASGCLVFYHDDGRRIPQKIIKRLKALIIPYVIFSIINSVMKLGVLAIQGGLTSDVIREEMIDLLITGNGTVWFLMTLFLVEVIFILAIKRWSQSKVLLLVVAVVGLILPYLITDALDGPFGIVIKRVIAALGYYCLGLLLAEFIESLKDRMLFLVGIILFVLGSLSYILFGSEYSMFGGTFESAPASLAASLCIGVGIVMLCALADRNRIRNKITALLTYYGKNSLIVMLIHPILLLFATYPLGGWFGSLEGITGVILSLLLFVVLTVLEVPFVIIINRYLPWMIGKRKKYNRVA